MLSMSHELKQKKKKIKRPKINGFFLIHLRIWNYKKNLTGFKLICLPNSNFLLEMKKRNLRKIK